jgi:hypothetical protein
MGERRRYLEAKPMVGRDSQVHGNQRRGMVQFVRQRYFRMTIAVSNSSL